jgi:hypothetical protein
MRWKDQEFPANDAFLESWRPLLTEQAAVSMSA